MKATAPDQLAGAVHLAPRPEERWPYYAEDEVAAAVRVLESGAVNQWTGPDVFEFQKLCERKFGGGHGVALANGSVALELALRAFGIGPGDEVVVSPRSFIASASCAMLVGATPVFADVDIDSGNITPESVKRVLTSRTRAVIPVHLAGWPADVRGIMDLVRGRDIYVIEDCAQAHGAEVAGCSVGSFGDSAAFSFCQDKIISTGGEGGYTSFKDRAKWEWAWSFKDHGKALAKMTSESAQRGLFRCVHDSVGTNWRLTGPQAAIGLAQLEKLENWRDTRTRNAQVWMKALEQVGRLRVPLPGSAMRHAYYKLYFYVEGETDEDAARRRAEILKRSAELALRVFSGSCSEVYLEKGFSELPRPHCPVSRSLGARSLMVEVHPTLRPDLLQLRAERLAKIAHEVFRNA